MMNSNTSKPYWPLLQVGIAWELKEPKQSIFNSFTAQTIDSIRISAAFLAIVIFIMITVRAVNYMMQNKKDMELETGNLRDEPASDFVKVEDSADVENDFVKVGAEQV